MVLNILRKVREREGRESVKEKKRVQGGRKRDGREWEYEKERRESEKEKRERYVYKEEIKREDKYVFIIVGQKRSMHLHTYIGSIGRYLSFLTTSLYTYKMMIGLFLQFLILVLGPKNVSFSRWLG